MKFVETEIKFGTNKGEKNSEALIKFKQLSNANRLCFQLSFHLLVHHSL